MFQSVIYYYVHVHERHLLFKFNVEDDAITYLRIKYAGTTFFILCIKAGQTAARWPATIGPFVAHKFARQSVERSVFLRICVYSRRLNFKNNYLKIIYLSVLFYILVS